MEGDKRAQVNRFLTDFKKTATARPIQFIQRLEYNETVKDLGFTRRNCVDVVLALSADDYVSGPEEDRDRPGFVWVFGKRIGREIYIKLKLYEAGAIAHAKCISFHYAEYRLAFPLRTAADDDC